MSLLGHTILSRNYLRVRGEYLMQISGMIKILELPPRARRIQISNMFAITPMGTTSACAENTVGASWRPKPYWNYLRVRGEYLRNLWKKEQ